MGRKRTRFDWSADPDDPDLREAAPRPGRAPLKEHLDAVQDFVQALIARPAAERQRLPVAPELLHEIEVLAQLGPTPARKRQLSYVKRLLADQDLDALREALEGESPHEQRARRADRWRRRLLAEGDEALQAFLQACPGADRQQLRALLRRAQTSETAHRPLFEAVLAALETEA